MKNFDDTKLRIRLIHKVIGFLDLQSTNVFIKCKLNEKIVRNLPKDSLERLSPLTLGWFAFEFAFQTSRQGGILDINNQ